jgi:WD40 repeat protein
MKKCLVLFFALICSYAWSQKDVRTMYSAMGKITHCEFSPDGSLGVACSELVEAYGERIATLTVFDIASEKMTKEFAINALFATFSPDNSKLLYWDYSKGLVIRNLATDEVKELIENKKENLVFRAKFSRDGKIIALGGVDGTVKIMDATTYQVVKTFNSNDSKRICIKLDFMSDGTLVTQGDGITKTWDVSKGQEILSQKVRPNRDELVLGFATEVNKILLCFKDSTFVSDSRSGKVFAKNNFANFYNGAFSPKGSMYLLCDSDGVYAFNGDATFEEKNGIAIPAVQWMDINRAESKIILGSEVNVLIVDFSFFQQIANRKN